MQIRFGAQVNIEPVKTSAEEIAASKVLQEIQARQQQLARARKAEQSDLKAMQAKLNKKLQDLPTDQVQIRLSPSQADSKNPQVQRPIRASIIIKGDQKSRLLVGGVSRQQTEQGPESVKAFVKRVQADVHNLLRIARMQKLI